MAGLLGGFGWNANARSYERDRAALRQELHGLVREEGARLQEQSTASGLKLSEELHSLFASRESTVIARGQKAAKDLRVQLESQLRDMGSRVAEFEVERLMRDAVQSRKNNVIVNSICTELALVAKANEILMSWRSEPLIAEALDRVRNDLRTKPELDAYSVGRIMEGMENTPDKFKPEIESLKALITELRSS